LFTQNFRRGSVPDHETVAGFFSTSFEGGRKYGKEGAGLLEFWVDSSPDTAKTIACMKSSSRALGQGFIGVGADSFQLALSRPAFQRAAFGYSLAVVSVAAAVAIKLILQHFNVGYPLSSSFLAAIATCLDGKVIFNDLNV